MPSIQTLLALVVAAISAYFIGKTLLYLKNNWASLNHTYKARPIVKVLILGLIIYLATFFIF